MSDLLTQLAGAGLCLLAIADLYITVLYARQDLNLLSARLSALVWRLFRTVGQRTARNGLLTFCGPTLIVLIPLTWVGLLLVGFALISWPALGDQIHRTGGTTPTDFYTAIYYSGYTLSTLGYGDIVPDSGFYRVMAVIESLLGFAVLSLSVTYLMSVYSALVRRNTLAAALHHQTDGTDDAAELLARLGSGGTFADAGPQLASLVRGLHDLYESHHSYPVLHYFRFRESFYGMAHMVGMIADVAALALTALDPQPYRGFIRSAALAEARSGTAYMLARLSRLFLPLPYRSEGDTIAPEELQRWKERFLACTKRLTQADIAVSRTPDEAAAHYVRLRRQWDAQTKAFRHYMLEDEPSHN